MPPEKNKTQDTLKQDNVQAELDIVETPASIEQPVEQVEQVPPEPASPEERPPSAPLPEDLPPTQGRTSPVAPPSSAPPRGTTFPRDFVQKLLIKARARIQERKQKKLDKIMTLFEAKPQVANKDIQKLLRTTKRSATRYLNQLEKEQKIIQVGVKGRGVKYIKKQ